VRNKEKNMNEVAATSQQLVDDGAVITALREALLSSPLRKVVFAHRNVLAAFVVVEHGSASSSPIVYVIGLGSGTRSVGFAKYAGGYDESDAARLLQWRRQRLFTLDDGHAEVMARRAMHVFLLNEMERLLAQPPSPAATPSPITFDASSGTFAWKRHSDLHLVVTQVPCGAFGVTPNVPEWSTGAHVLVKTPSPHTCCSLTQCGDIDGDQPSAIAMPQATRGVKTHMGHAVSLVMDESLHLMRGVSRTKPGAGTPSLSMSCSDKILRWVRDGVEGKCLHGLLSARRVPCVIHIARRSDDDHQDDGDAQRRRMWEADVQESLQHAAAAPPASSRVAACPRLSWFDINDLVGHTPSSEGNDSGEGASIAAWPGMSAAPAGVKYCWGSCTINTKDGVVHGMTRGRFLASIATAQAAAASGNVAKVLTRLSSAVVARQSSQHLFSGISYIAKQQVVEQQPPADVSVERLCALGCGGAPILRWTMAIRAASLMEALNELNVDIKGNAGSSAGSEVASAAETQCPFIEVRGDTLPHDTLPHPYFTFRSCRSDASSMKGHWVNKWDAVPMEQR
jgi:hypothetical protein